MKKANLVVFIIVTLGVFSFQCSQSVDTSNSQIVDFIKKDSVADESMESEASIEDVDSSRKAIERTISLFRTRNVDAIAKVIQFPLKREFPLPAIQDSKVFKSRFNEVFDDYLISKIANSTIDQWTEVGWRGTMLDDGLVWMANSDGVITAVNYQSEVEKQMLQDLIAKTKEGLHPSLKLFKSPMYRIRTKTYIIRIDELEDGGYRFASWKVGHQESSKPDVILNNGVLEMQGSAGNQELIFSSGDIKYLVYRHVLGADDTAEVLLEVEKKGQVILTEEGVLIYE